MVQVNVLYMTLAVITMIFVLFVFAKMFLFKKLGIKVCAICAAVSLTWAGLLFANWSGFEVSNLIIGILMGESVIGVMYAFEAAAKRKHKEKLLWMKLLIVLLGTLMAYVLLTAGLSLSFGIALLVSLIFTLTTFNLLNKKKKKPIKKKYSKFKKEIEKLEKKFENCCD